MNRYRLAVLFEHAVAYLVLILAAIFALGPIYWVINTSLKPETRIVSYPPQWWPDPISIGNYVKILAQSTILRFFLNSIFLAVGTIFLVLFLGVHAAYAVARYNFRGKNMLMFFLLATIMVPGVVTLIPIYLMAVQLGLGDTYLILILVYAAWQTPTVVWLLRAFFENIPRELEDAAMIDGCSRLSAFYYVVLPLARPGLAAAAVVVFVWVWNELILALNLTTSNSVRPLTVGLYFFIGETGIEWGKITAAASAALLPVVVLLALLQKQFIQGLTAGATKG